MSFDKLNELDNMLTDVVNKITDIQLKLGELQGQVIEKETTMENE